MNTSPISFAPTSPGVKSHWDDTLQLPRQTPIQPEESDDGAPLDDAKTWAALGVMNVCSACFYGALFWAIFSIFGLA